METNQQKTDTQTPKDPELAIAEREAALAKARKEKAEFEKDEAKVRRDKLQAELTPLGDVSKITAPAGDVTTDASGFIEVQILGREAARETAKRLKDALDVHCANIDTLVIYNSADITAVAAYVSVLEQLEEFNHEFGKNEKEIKQELDAAQFLLDDPDFIPQDDLGMTAAIAAPAIATGVVKSVAEFVNLFRTTTDFKNKELSVTEELIVSYIVKSLSTQAITIYYPAYFPPKILASGQPSPLASTLKGIREHRFTATANIRRIEQAVEKVTKAKDADKAAIASKSTEQTNKAATLNAMAPQEPDRARLQTEINQLHNDIERLGARNPRYDAALANLNDVKSKLQFINTAAEQVVTNLDTPDSATKVTPLSQLIRAERLASILTENKTYTLRLTVSANGTTKIKKNLFFDACVRHSAGATLVYQLFNKDGRVVDADGIQFYYDWKSAEQVRTMVSGSR